MKKILFCILLCLSLFSLLGCEIVQSISYYFREDTTYFRKLNWQVDDDEFTEKYIDHCMNLVYELKDKYSLAAECREERYNDYATARVWLYNEEFTVLVVLRNLDRFSTLIIEYYYYNEDSSQLLDYSRVNNVISFINELLDSISFEADPSTNEFEILYNNAIISNDLTAKDINAVDAYNFGYYVELENDNNTLANSRYMLLNDFENSKKHNRFVFRGCLRPLDL